MTYALQLLFSHHIYSSKKIKSLVTLSQSLDLCILLKPGRGGIIIVEGEDGKVTDCCADIMVRF